MADLHIHTLCVRHHHITCDSPVLVQHGMGHDAIALDLDAEWDGLSVRLVLGPCADATDLLYEGEPVTVPAATLAEAGWLPVSVVGYGGDGTVRVTTERCDHLLRVVESGCVDGSVPPEDAPDLLGQLVEAAGKATEAAGEADKAAESASAAASAAKDAADEAKATADGYQQQITEVTTKVGGIETDVSELSAEVSGAVEDAAGALSAATKAQQDIDGFKTTVEQTYQPKGDYATSADLQSYATKSEVEQTAGELSASVAALPTTETLTQAIASEASAREKADRLLETEVNGKLDAADLVAGTNVTITLDPETGHVTISAAGGGGGDGSYVLPVATANSLGGVKASAQVLVAIDGAMSLAHDSVTHNELANNSVMAGHLTALCVSSDKIQNRAVGTNKISDGAVTADKIAQGVIPTPATDDDFQTFMNY